MFRGSIPRTVSQVTDEYMRSWGGVPVYIGCSGALTVERHLAGRGLALHGNDVLLYSTAIGRFYAHDPLPLELSEWGTEQVGWVAESMTGPAERLAALMVLSAFTMAIGRGEDGDNPYYAKMRAAYRKQWPKLHADTLTRIHALDLRLASFTCEDVATWLGRVPEDAAFITYPPFDNVQGPTYFAKDYTKLERLFDWTPPPYEDLTSERLSKLYLAIADRPRWLFAVNREVPELAGKLRATVQNSNRGTIIHIYADAGRPRIITPRQAVEPLRIAHLAAGEALTGRIRLLPITHAQFASLRSEYMNANIAPGTANLAVAVVVGDRVVGAFAYSWSSREASWDKYLPEPHAYLMSDFPVSGTDYPRLSKLIVMAAMSSQARDLCARYGHRPFRSVTTTAFSNNPMSAKYGRGVPGLRLLKREENKVRGKSFAAKFRDNDTYYNRKWDLQYGGLLGTESLDTLYALWQRKHGRTDA